MKLTVLLLLAASAYAQKPPVPNRPPQQEEEALRAEIASLRAQLRQLQTEFKYEMTLCVQPDVMEARLASVQAQKKALEAAKPKETPK